jgi:hypothetical protein
MSTFVKGDAVILYIYNGVDAYEPIGCLTSNSLQVTRNVIETQTKCDPSVIIKAAGTTSSDINFEAVYIKTESGKTDYNACLDFINSIEGQSVTWKMTSGQDDGSAYYGTGVFSDLSLDAAAGDEFATYSGTISNSGLVLTEDPNDE